MIYLTHHMNHLKSKALHLLYPHPILHLIHYKVFSFYQTRFFISIHITTPVFLYIFLFYQIKTKITLKYTSITLIDYYCVNKEKIKQDSITLRFKKEPEYQLKFFPYIILKCVLSSIYSKNSKTINSFFS